tara:strand:- start:551 stop:3025 length:2475 start_codon:yes stop_codon:yes gene_type:complete
MRLYERFADKGYHTSIATTFGIDFDAYENIVLPRLRGAGCRNNMVLADGRMLTHALGGASALPRQAGRYYTATGARAMGLFHPKIFFQVGRKGGRLIIGSANMTAAGLAGNLELVAMMECEADDSGAQRLIAQAWQYLSGLIDPADPMVPAQRDWMLGRAAWLRSAAPATGVVSLSDGTEAALLIADRQSGIGRRFSDLIDEPVKRLTVISPYWDERLAALSYLDERLSPLENAAIIDRETGLFPGDAANTIRNLKLYHREKFEAGRFIHAKAVIAETDSFDHLLLGSANCTVAALGKAEVAGSNDEACIYRRLPAGTAIDALGLSKLLQDEKRIEPSELEPFGLEDDIPLDALANQHPGTFSLRGTTLTWRPSAKVAAPEDQAIELLGATGSALDISPKKIEDSKPTVLRYQVEIEEELPAFAKVDGAQNFPPAIIIQVDVLHTAIRETHSKKTENVLAQLDGETEASLALLEVLDVLEQIEEPDSNAPGEGVSIPKAQRQDDGDNAQGYKKLSYAEFVAGRRPHHAGPILHNSLGGSDVSIVRGFLNRIVGLNALQIAAEDDDEDYLKAAFDLGDETEDASGALEAGEEFDRPSAPLDEQAIEAEERRQKARQRKATKDQIVAAVSNFSKRIDLKQAKGQLSTRDFLRLRALLMIICAAAWKGTDKTNQNGRTSLQVLPVEGDPHSWPVVIGRLLFKVFGGTNPAIRSLELDADHDQLPADLLECWATCFWCLQACLSAPVSRTEADRIEKYIKPLAVETYRLTFLSAQGFLDQSVVSVMDAMNKQYSERLGIDPNVVLSKHKACADTQLELTESDMSAGKA